MDLTRESIEKILELAPPGLLTLGELEYSKDKLHLITPPSARPFSVISLDALVEYLTSNVDRVGRERIIVHVENQSEVKVFSGLQPGHRDREEFVIASPILPHIYLDNFVERERFNIMLQSCFVDGNDRAKVLEAIATITKSDSNGVEIADDGITQSVEMQAGRAVKTRGAIPNPVWLAPYRTFPEIEQPVSPFVLRVNDNMDVALFEADGGAWRLEAMKRIKAYLEEKLEGYVILA